MHISGNGPQSAFRVHFAFVCFVQPFFFFKYLMCLSCFVSVGYLGERARDSERCICQNVSMYVCMKECMDVLIDYYRQYLALFPLQH